MAITKQAKNITITVNNHYELVVGEILEKVADVINIEATNENITLASNKKILTKGNK
ncbi:hypothetical protein [Tenacibaculum sp. Bg11-29]|uniref:hypothetical protein n=1 Tax=Tenacibaculum sp. Bg11-29 TaxID=2058306 RepID=UPI0012FEB7B0|nr:hypothetical protein [Tenacibaculum sp. Bg11-29]